MSNKGVIELFDANGEVKEYKLFSARLPEFLKAYPKSEGYRVSVETSDPLSSKPGLLRLYEAAISAGSKPSDVGLPAVPAGDVVVFTAALLDKDGNVLEKASALRVIRQYKDWEKGETAARQRLIAALGFGGDCFDADELEDISEQGLDVERKPEDQTPPSKAPGDKNAAKAGPAQQQQPAQPAQQASEADEEAPAQPVSTKADEPAPTNEQAVEAAPQGAEEKPAAKADPKGDEEAGEVIPDRLIRQIQHQAKLKSVEPPQPKTVKEAKQMLKQLMQA